jgi:hypothetical protein
MGIGLLKKSLPDHVRTYAGYDGDSQLLSINSNAPVALKEREGREGG